MDINGSPHIRHDIHIDDAIQAILLCLEKDAAIGEDFIFSSPAPYSSSEHSQILVDKFGWPIEEVPTGMHSWSLNCEKARTLLGYSPQVNLMDWLREGLS